MQMTAVISPLAADADPDGGGAPRPWTRDWYS